MKIQDIMTRNPEVVTPNTSLQNAAQKMESLDVGSMPVCNGKKLVGMITDRDITIRATAQGMNPSQGSEEQRLIFFAAAGGGVVAMLTGFIGGSIPAAKATQIETDPEYTFTPMQVQDGMDTYNEQLRAELNLSSEEVLLIEAAGAGAQVQPYIVPSSSGLGLQLGVGGSF